MKQYIEIIRMERLIAAKTCYVDEESQVLVN